MTKQQIKDTDPIGVPHEKFLLFISTAVMALLTRGIHSVAIHVSHDAVSFMIAQGELKFKQTRTIAEIEKDLATYDVMAFEFAKAADDRFIKYQEEQAVKMKKTKH